MNSDELKAKAHELATQAEEKAQAALVSAEAKFPLGTVIVCLVVGVVIGLYLRGLFA